MFLCPAVFNLIELSRVTKQGNCKPNPCAPRCGPKPPIFCFWLNPNMDWYTIKPMETGKPNLVFLRTFPVKDHALKHKHYEHNICTLAKHPWNEKAVRGHCAQNFLRSNVFVAVGQAVANNLLFFIWCGIKVRPACWNNRPIYVVCTNSRPIASKNLIKASMTGHLRCGTDFKIGKSAGAVETAKSSCFEYRHHRSLC